MPHNALASAERAVVEAAERFIHAGTLNGWPHLGATLYQLQEADRLRDAVDRLLAARKEAGHE